MLKEVSGWCLIREGSVWLVLRTHFVMTRPHVFVTPATRQSSYKVPQPRGKLPGPRLAAQLWLMSAIFLLTGRGPGSVEALPFLSQSSESTGSSENQYHPWIKQRSPQRMMKINYKSLKILFLGILVSLKIISKFHHCVNTRSRLGDSQASHHFVEIFSICINW